MHGLSLTSLYRQKEQLYAYLLTTCSASRGILRTSIYFAREGTAQDAQTREHNAIVIQKQQRLHFFS